MDAEGLGIPQLDTLLAPVPEGARVLIAHDPGIEAEPFLYQIAHAHTTAGRDVVYVVTSRPPGSVEPAMASYDLAPAAGPLGAEGVVDGDGGGGRLHLLDAFSARRPAEPEIDAARVEDPGDPAALADALARAARDHPGAVCLVEGLSAPLDEAGPEAFLEALPALAEALSGFSLSCALFTRWPYGEDLQPLYDAFDALVSVRGVEGRILLSQYFAVERAAWKEAAGEAVDDAPRLFKPLSPGGIYVYVPKIAVTGPYNAGKSTFIRSVSDRAVSVDRLGTTVALDHGHATIDGVAADLFGTPGQTRFDPILETIADRGLGMLLIVDAARPDTFDRAREMFERMWRYGLPALVVANKQDLPEALAPEEVRDHLRLHKEVEVVGCVGQEPESARFVLEQLIDRILTSGMRWPLGPGAQGAGP